MIFNEISCERKALMIHQVRTLYACVGEHETELSFEPNAIITSGEWINQLKLKTTLSDCIFVFKCDPV